MSTGTRLSRLSPAGDFAGISVTATATLRSMTTFDGHDPSHRIDTDDDLLVVAELRTGGLTYSEIKSRLDGATRMRRGVFAQHRPADARQDHLLRARAVLAGHREGTALAHVTAAAWHGLPLWRAELADVHVLGSTHAKRRRGVKYHSYPVEPRTVMLGGLPVTDAAQTVWDCARTCRFSTAVVLGDAALHSGLVQPGELAAVAERYPRVKGRRAAGRVFASLDGASESPGETRCRLLLRRLGYRVQSQYEIVLADGATVRADFRILSTRVLVEFDGRTKYSHGEDVLWREKVRADRLADLGWQIVRVTWADLSYPREVEVRIQRTLARASQ